MIKQMYLLLAVLFMSSVASIAQTKLPQFFSDKMVFQQNDTVAIWGTDKANTVIKIRSSWGGKAKTQSDKDGVWRCELITPCADNIAHELIIKGSSTVTIKEVLLGEVWFASGQSNMTMQVKGGFNQPIAGSNETILNSNNNRIRMWTSDLTTSNLPMNTVGGSWESAKYNTTPNFSAVAYYFAERLEHVLDVPVGIILSGWGGTPVEAWMNPKSLQAFDDFSYHTNPDTKEFRQPSVLWNAMIHPFLGYKVKGMLWYQGESNWEHPFEYAELFPTMITSWREHWGLGELPFYYVQVSPIERKQGNTAFIREAQEQTMDKVNNTGMVVIHDIGECWQIHPREKRTIGERLAYWAFYNEYDITSIGYQSPRFIGMEATKNNRIVLEFSSDNGGLSTFDNELIGFQIAGSDRVFYDAKAHIKWNTSNVVVWNDQVKKPVAVRYLFDDCGKATLFSGSGLPVGSFRTDDWDDFKIEE